MQINETQECALADVIRLFQPTKGAVAYCAGSTRRDTVQWPSLSISAYQNQFFHTKETNLRKAE